MWGATSKNSPILSSLVSLISIFLTSPAIELVADSICLLKRPVHNAPEAALDSLVEIKIPTTTKNKENRRKMRELEIMKQAFLQKLRSPSRGKTQARSPLQHESSRKNRYAKFVPGFYKLAYLLVVPRHAHPELTHGQLNQIHSENPRRRVGHDFGAEFGDLMPKNRVRLGAPLTKRAALPDACLKVFWHQVPKFRSTS